MWEVKMNNAPVIIFAYNRPAHLSRTLAALSQNPEAIGTDLIIYCDRQPESASDKTVRLVALTRIIAQDEKRFGSLKVVERDGNFGLAKNITEGVTEVMEKFGRAIILEDDLVVARNFLQFMNSALQKYKDEKRVACISGYVYPLRKEGAKAFFIRGADCWGWATWSDRWKQFNPNVSELKKRILKEKLQKEFDFNDTYPYFQMLEDREKGLNQSWAILWYASSFLNNQLCLYPPYSLVHNIGNDGSGTHSLVSTSHYDVDVDRADAFKFPDEISEGTDGRMSFELFLKSMRPSLLSVAIRRLKSLHRKIRASGGNNDWTGNFNSWSEAQALCSGYDAASILDTVLKVVLKVKNGEAAFERDGVAFDDYQYSVHVQSTLMEIAKKLNRVMVVADFGGSLGSLYFQYKRFLGGHLATWNVIEQPHFVVAGKKYVEDEVLKFYPDFESLQRTDQPDLLILSSVLCYMEKPYDWIDKFCSWNVPYILIDRTAFIIGEERITIQQVPSEIYNASYPAWFLNEQKFLEALLPQYRLIRELPDTIDGENFVDGLRCYRKGFYLQRRSLNGK